MSGCKEIVLDAWPVASEQIWKILLLLSMDGCEQVSLQCDLKMTTQPVNTIKDFIVQKENKDRTCLLKSLSRKYRRTVVDETLRLFSLFLKDLCSGT